MSNPIFTRFIYTTDHPNFAKSILPSTHAVCERLQRRVTRDVEVSRSTELSKALRIQFRVFSVIEQVSGSRADDLVLERKQRSGRSTNRNLTTPKVILHHSKAHLFCLVPT